MNIKRLEVPFTQVANSVLNDNTISWKAKGIFAYIYSKPDGWDFSTVRMKNDATDGIDALVSGIKELEDTGYLIRKKLPSGRVIYTIGYIKKPVLENPRQGKSHSGKIQDISNKDIQSNKDRTKIAQATPDAPFSLKDEIIKLEDNSRRALNIIALYASERQVSLKGKILNKAQMSEFIKRHLRVAGSLEKYTDNQIVDSMEQVKRKYKDIDWTLDTCLKELTK